jgi:predicted Zn-dependent protease
MAHASYLDPESYRMITMITNTVMGGPATQLMMEGHKDEARKVAVETFEKMPKRVYLMRDILGYIPIINVLYETGETKRANEIVNRNLKFMTQNMRWYQDIAQTKPELEYSNIGTALRALGAYKSILASTSEKQLLQQVTDLEKSYKQQYGVE